MINKKIIYLYPRKRLRDIVLFLINLYKITIYV